MWVVAAGAATLGALTNDLAAPGLIGGLVLIVMLIGFTIMQSAFSSVGATATRRSGRRAARAGDDRLRRRDLRLERRRRPDLCQPPTSRLSSASSAARWKGRPRRGSTSSIRSTAIAIQRRSRAYCTQRSGRISHDIRLRGADSHYHSFILKARPVVNAEGEVVRVIGALSDVTETKAAEERILHDAIHDNLTGLPNRELFFDRLGAAIIQVERPGAPTPAVLAVDIDRFKDINDALGMAFGDSALLDGGAAARARAQARRHAGAHRRRSVRRHRHVRRRRERSPKVCRIAARDDERRRSVSAIARWR